MKLEIDSQFKKVFGDIPNFPNSIQQAIMKSALLVQNQAKINSPYLTGSLRRSITTDYSMISNLTAIIGVPGIIPYGRRREYENNKNPDTKFYLKRGYTDNKSQIDQIIKDSLKSFFG